MHRITAIVISPSECRSTTKIRVGVKNKRPTCRFDRVHLALWIIILIVFVIVVIVIIVVVIIRFNHTGKIKIRMIIKTINVQAYRLRLLLFICCFKANIATE